MSSNRRAVAALLAAALFFAWDIAQDLGAGNESAVHIAVECLVFGAVLAVLGTEILRGRRLRREVRSSRARLARLSGEFQAALDQQFIAWGLSPSEGEVALLLIKGLSMGEIARLRQVREKTVRQQASRVYAKSSCTGRHELVAHFVEDLLTAGDPPSAV
jgi:DNA-binding CsgD family transcriptional regulator